jgi:hypothetical protein
VCLMSTAFLASKVAEVERVNQRRGFLRPLNLFVG